MKNQSNTDGPIKSIFTGFLILVLHLILILGIGVVVLFFSGIVSYMLYIFIAGSAAILITAYLAYRRMKKEGKNLAETLSLPVFSGRKVEVSFLGGLASLKFENPGDSRALGTKVVNPNMRIEDSETMLIRELNDLVRLLDDNLITIDEYNKAKHKIFHP